MIINILGNPYWLSLEEFNVIKDSFKEVVMEDWVKLNFTTNDLDRSIVEFSKKNIEVRFVPEHKNFFKIVTKENFDLITEEISFEEAYMIVEEAKVIQNRSDHNELRLKMLLRFKSEVLKQNLNDISKELTSIKEKN